MPLLSIELYGFFSTSKFYKRNVFKFLKVSFVVRDSLIIAFVNCGTSVFAGFVIFATVGYMAQTQGKSVEDVASEGSCTIKIPKQVF